MGIKSSRQSLISRRSTTTATSGTSGGTSSGGSSTITSISHLAANGVALTANAAPTTSNSLIKIVGTGFASGANVYLNGLLQPSANVTFVNSTELRLNMPALTTNTYSLMTFDSTGAGSVYYPGVRFDPYPLWGNTVFNLTTAISQQLTVTDYGSGSVTFSLASGNTLPSGLTLSANGLMSGTIAGGTYTFYVNAIDSENEISPQQVTLIAVTNITAEYLIVAGGAGGGYNVGGGGGAGGYRTNYGSTPITLAPSTAYTVTVGSGGAGAPSQGTRGASGEVSSLVGGAISIESAGGGGGGGFNEITGNSGGSGGGSGSSGQNNAPAAGAGNTPSVNPSQGNSGGTGWYGGFNRGGNQGWIPGGGGGGAGQTGFTVDSGAGGAGGAGVSNAITGVAVTYAGGGGGCGWYASNGAGGAGGGGSGTTPGTVNTGGGGGGGASGTSGSTGGSGVVILRTATAAVSTTGSPTVTTDAGYNVYQFTASGSITF